MESQKAIYKRQILATLKLAIPVVIGQLGQVMMSMVDSLMVGHLGAVPLAAAALANGLFFLILVFGIGVSQALTPLVAESVGAGEPKRCGLLLKQALLVNVSTGVVLTFISFVAAEIVPFLHQPIAIVPQAVAYLRIMGISVIPVMLFLTYRQYSEGLSMMWPAMILTLGANLFNVFFNWVFIHGKFGFPAMGLTGAGLSTLLTRVVMTIVLIVYMHKALAYKKYLVPFFTKPLGVDWKMIKNIARIGTGTGLQYFFEVGAFSGAAVMIGWMGADYLASHQIALSAASFSFMFAIGVSAAAAIRVGKAKGEGNLIEMRRAGFSAFMMAGLIMFSFGVLFVLFRFTIPRFFINDLVVVQMAGSLLIIAALFQVSDGLQSAGLGVLRGIGDVRVPTIATFASYWIIGLPGGYVLAFVLGLKVFGVWIGLLLGLTSSASLLTTRFHLKTKKK